MAAKQLIESVQAYVKSFSEVISYIEDSLWSDGQSLQGLEDTGDRCPCDYYKRSDITSWLRVERVCVNELNDRASTPQKQKST